MLTIKDVAHFIWDFGQEFFLETEHGNYIWSDPDYDGDNTLRKTHLSYDMWIGDMYGRDKGTHYIEDYCGPNVKIIED